LSKSRLFVIGMISLLSMALPTVAASSASAATTQPASSPAAVPLSAGGCNGQICIRVIGTGLHVNTVTIIYSGSICNTNDGGHIIFSNPRTTFPVLGMGDNGFLCNPSQRTSTIDRSFANNSTLCVTLDGVPGEPCVTIHS
jgi:hypothetical protein